MMIQKVCFFLSKFLSGFIINLPFPASAPSVGQAGNVLKI